MMKTIIKSILILMALLNFNSVKSQSTPSCAGTGTNPSALPSAYTPNWDWQDPTPTNWYAQISTGTLAMGSPFTSGSNTDDMLKIIDGLDYDPLQGWVLLAKDFGSINQSNAANATPYFILYNKYKSIIRLFIYYGNTNPNVNSASVILKWSGNNGSTQNNSLLTLSNNFALANENYPVSNNPEKHVNYLNQVSNSGAWGVTEYLVNFDPNTVKSVGNFQRINFDFKLSTNSAIGMTGDFSFSTKSATTKNPPPPTVNSANPNLLDYVVNGKNALSKAPKKSEIVAGFNQIAATASVINQTYSSKFTQQLLDVNNSLQNGKLKAFLIGAAGYAEDVGGILGGISSVLELFMSKSNSAVATNTESFIQPTISEGSMKLTGTITTEYNPLSISVQLPGTSHKYSNGTVNCPDLPVYDCPLGTISLAEAPGIEVRTMTTQVRAGYFTCSIDYGMSYPPSCGTPPTGVSEFSLGPCGTNTYLFRRQQNCTANFPVKTIKSYKVTGDIKLSLNAAAGATIESAKAALLFEIKDNGGVPAFDLLQTSVTPTLCQDPIGLVPGGCGCFNPATCLTGNTPVWNPTSTFYETAPFINYAKNLLNLGYLKLSSYDANNGYHKFQTPFIDIDKFKNTAVTIEDGCNVYLKVLITMRPNNANDDQTPIVQLVTYAIPAGKFSSSNSTTPYTMTCDQRLEHDPTIIGVSNATSTIGNTMYTGYAVQTAPTTTVTANSTGTTNLEAFALVKLSPQFNTQVQSGGLFRAYLNPNAMGCETGTNALIVQTYSYNCSGNGANNRTALAIANIDPDGSMKFDDGKLTLAEELQNLHMRIAPNPNNGNFSLYFNKKVARGDVKIYNMMGQEVYKQELGAEATIYEINLDGILKAGAYYLSWYNINFVINQKFIIN